MSGHFPTETPVSHNLLPATFTENVPQIFGPVPEKDLDISATATATK